jgi:hypothetical protein
VASNENERTSDPPEDRNVRAPLPPSVERALAEARETARTGGRRPPQAGTKAARWLALIPVTALAVMGLLMMPRAAAPEDIPLPVIDGRALAATTRDDTQRAAAARAKRLSGDLLAVGTAMRAFNKAQLPGALPTDATDARVKLDYALKGLASEDASWVFDGLKALRALQLEGFLVEVAEYEATGKVTPELQELAGAFIERMESAGWVANHRVLMDDAQRRAAYKLVWTAAVGLDQNPNMALSIDEQRVLYTLYLRRPHVPEIQRVSLEGLRRDAKNEAECARAGANEQLAREGWRIDKIRKLGQIDPAYPAGYAAGVGYYRAGRYEQAAEAFRLWIEAHPDGPYSIRARNHLKAALTASGPS